MSTKNPTLHVILMQLPLMTRQDRERHGKLLERVTALVENGRLKPLLDSTRFTLEQVRAALDRLDKMAFEVQEFDRINLSLPNVEEFRTKKMKMIQPPSGAGSGGTESGK